MNSWEKFKIISSITENKTKFRISHEIFRFSLILKLTTLFQYITSIIFSKIPSEIWKPPKFFSMKFPSSSIKFRFLHKIPNFPASIENITVPSLRWLKISLNIQDVSSQANTFIPRFSMKSEFRQGISIFSQKEGVFIE